MADEQNQQTVTKDVVVSARVPVEGGKKAETKPYVLKEGVGAHYNGGELVEPGSTVQLTDAQYQAFSDKFEPAEQREKRQDREQEAQERQKQDAERQQKEAKEAQDKAAASQQPKK
jgi:hypothetical protein